MIGVERRMACASSIMSDSAIPMDNLTDCLHQLKIYTNFSAYRAAVVILRVSPQNRGKLPARIDGKLLPLAHDAN